VPDGGLETISITDLDVVLGRVNPDYFLGGAVQLDPERARAEVERQLAHPLGLRVERAAAGVIELFEETLKNEAVGRILGKGYSPADYALLCYGGGGPLHVAGYTAGVAYRDVLVPAWAAGFSASAAPAPTSSTATTRRSTCRSRPTSAPTRRPAWR
jgi:acetone carboxylase, beta subunit